MSVLASIISRSCQTYIWFVGCSFSCKLTGGGWNALPFRVKIFVFWMKVLWINNSLASQWEFSSTFVSNFLSSQPVAIACLFSLFYYKFFTFWNLNISFLTFWDISVCLNISRIEPMSVCCCIAWSTDRIWLKCITFFDQNISFNLIRVFANQV